MVSQTPSKKNLLLLTGILCIALNLRGSLTSVSAVLDLIRDDLSLSPAQAGFITTLPMLAFAFFSPVASRLSKKLSLEIVLLLALLLLIYGIVTRSLGGIVLLFSGTLAIGIAIAMINVLLPVLVKRDVPEQVTTVTALYVLAMGIGSGASTYFTLPTLHIAYGYHIHYLPEWALALLSNLIFPFLALVIWLPQLRQSKHSASLASESPSHTYLWCTKSAWCISLCLSLNAFMSYVVFSWLPAMVTEFGYSAHDGAVMQGWCQLGTGLPALLIIPVLKKFNDLRLLAMTMPVITLVCLTGILKTPAFAAIWSLLLGIGLGGGFITVLSLIGLRTHDTHQAATLSGKTQCLGYLFGAAGPVLIGQLHDITNGWTAPRRSCGSRRRGRARPLRPTSFPRRKRSRRRSGRQAGT